MARIRSVKPELFTHEGLFEAARDYQLPLQLAFIALFTQCDQWGRFRWQPRRLKLSMLPYHDDVDIVQVLDALAARGFIKKYEVNAEWYGCIPSWADHQKITRPEHPSGIPSPEGFIFKKPTKKNNSKHKKLLVSNNVPTEEEHSSNTVDTEYSCVPAEEEHGSNTVHTEKEHGGNTVGTEHDSGRAWYSGNMERNMEGSME